MPYPQPTSRFRVNRPSSPWRQCEDRSPPATCARSTRALKTFFPRPSKLNLMHTLAMGFIDHCLPALDTHRTPHRSRPSLRVDSQSSRTPRECADQRQWKGSRFVAYVLVILPRGRERHPASLPSYHLSVSTYLATSHESTHVAYPKDPRRNSLHIRAGQQGVIHACFRSFSAQGSARLVCDQTRRPGDARGGEHARG